MTDRATTLQILQALPGQNNTADDLRYARAEKRNGVAPDSIPSPEKRHAEAAHLHERQVYPHPPPPASSLVAQRCRCYGKGWPDTDEEGHGHCVKCGKPR